MKMMISQVALVVALLTLVSCGLKGPLYFPSEQQSAKTQVQEQK